MTFTRHLSLNLTVNVKETPMSADFPSKNIDWHKVPIGAKVREVTSKATPKPGCKPNSWYVVGEGADAAVANWGSQDAGNAQSSLSMWAAAGFRRR